MRHARHHTDLLPLHLIPQHTERTLRQAIGRYDEDFIEDMMSFAMVRSFDVNRILVSCF